MTAKARSLRAQHGSSAFLVNMLALDAQVVARDRTMSVADAVRHYGGNGSAVHADWLEYAATTSDPLLEIGLPPVPPIGVVGHAVNLVRPPNLPSQPGATCLRAQVGHVIITSAMLMPCVMLGRHITRWQVRPLVSGQRKTLWSSLLGHMLVMDTVEHATAYRTAAVAQRNQVRALGACLSTTIATIL